MTRKVGKPATPEKAAVYKERLNKLWKYVETITKKLTELHGSFEVAIRQDSYRLAILDWRSARNSCPECRSQNLSVYAVQLGSEVICGDCETYIRSLGEEE